MNIHNITTLPDTFLREFFRMREEISRDKNWGLNLSEEAFIKGMVLLNPQSYGARIERYIKNTFCGDKIPASANCGDFRTAPHHKLGGGKAIEVKISLLTPTNNDLNLVQIRPFQNIDFYLCVAYDLRDLSHYKKYAFLLSHKEMIAEVKCMGATAAHGTKTANTKNKNVELRLSIRCNKTDATFLRWQKQYSTDLLGM